jgi:hypothetical protein
MHSIVALFITSLIFVFVAYDVSAQIPSASSSRAIPTEVEQSETRVSQIIARAEDHFQKGKMHLDNKKHEKAREEFDFAVDSILESGFDVRASQRLQAYYLELVERIYREEVPLHQPVPSNVNTAVLVAQNTQPREPATQKNTSAPQVGFRDQKFDPSPLDELSRLVLAPEATTRQRGDENSPGCKVAPTIRDIKLGMSAGQFTGLYPRSKIVRKRNEVGEWVSWVNAGNEQRLKGVEQLFAFFLDGNLLSFSIYYDNQIEWKGVDQFVEQFSRSTGVPAQWSGNGGRWLLCKSFYINAELVYGKPRVRIIDVAGLNNLAEREKRLKSPSNFRP